MVKKKSSLANNLPTHQFHTSMGQNVKAPVATVMLAPKGIQYGAVWQPMLALESAALPSWSLCTPSLVPPDTQAASLTILKAFLNKQWAED